METRVVLRFPLPSLTIWALKLSVKDLDAVLQALELALHVRRC
jgi:hypothetical protein